MTGRERIARTRLGLTVAVVCAGLAGGCTSAVEFTDEGVPSGSFQLVAFDSCDEALTGLRSAAKAVVGPYGLGGPIAFAEESVADRAAGEGAAPPAAPNAAGRDAAQGPSVRGPAYSGTNTHEAGVDEPDLVKTDGRRIVTVSGGVLRVVDAASAYLTGSLDLSQSHQERERVRFAPSDLLLAGDRALVLLNAPYQTFAGGPVADVAPAMDPVPPEPGRPGGPVPPQDWPIAGPSLVLVDLAGAPRVLSTLRIDGSLIDARQVGATVRVVVRSAPRLSFRYDPDATDKQRLEANRDLIDRTPIEDWLPRIEVTTGGRTEPHPIGCGNVTRPASYTGANLLTVLTIDLAARNGLGDGEPLTLVADGDTVYSNGPSLYVASDRRWRAGRTERGADLTDERTEVYKFDTSRPGRPRFVAGGSVPGYLINQYAMSEWEGNLRIATTREQLAQGRPSQSGVYVLGHNGRRLAEIGRVEGLGKGERIYAVRFMGPIGYVVTFRQVDPLYTVDLSIPARPVVRGELKIPGYSAYLHPVSASRLIGIGQNADDGGRVSGTQVSLFDLGDLAAPTRLASYTVSGAHSEAEFDPHAFLYWPAAALVAVPLQVRDVITRFDPNSGPDVVPRAAAPAVGVLLLRISDAGITEVGFVRHPGGWDNPGYPASIRRSLIIGSALWTVSDAGLMATDLSGLTRLAWIPFS